MEVDLVDEEFRPFALKLRFKSQREVDDFYNIFNHTFITESCKTDFGELRALLCANKTENDFKEFSASVQQRFANKLDLL